MFKKLLGRWFSRAAVDVDEDVDDADFPPESLIVPHDDYHGRYVGRTPVGEQFFITTPFVPNSPVQQGREFVALYLFDVEGDLLEAKVEELGSRTELVGEEEARMLPGNIAPDNPRSQEWIQQQLSRLGEVEYCDIRVKPFAIEKFQLIFGLIPDSPDADEDPYYVILEPGNYMAFTPPWRGEYDT